MPTGNKTGEVTIVEYKSLLLVIITILSRATTTPCFNRTLSAAHPDRPVKLHVFLITTVLIIKS